MIRRRRRHEWYELGGYAGEPIGWCVVHARWEEKPSGKRLELAGAPPANLPAVPRERVLGRLHRFRNN